MGMMFGILLGLTYQVSLNQVDITAPSKRPNIVFVLVDDMGPGDLGCYGGSIAPTPNIDRIAREGTRFTRYYSAAPICSPSRCGLITGNFPARWKITSFLQTKAGNRECGQVDFLDPNAPSLPRELASSGYATAHIGKWHLGGGRDVANPPKFRDYGYQLGLGTYESPEPAAPLGLKTTPWGKELEPGQVPRHQRTKWMVDQTLKFIAEQKAKPCFVNLWLDDVHDPWVPEGDKNLPKGNPKPRLSAVIAELDLQMGRLVKGLPENTLLIFASDNGALPTLQGQRTMGFRGSKLSLYEGGIRMPFLVRWPGKVPVGKVNETTVIAAVDMFPSIMEIVGIQKPVGYSGDGEDLSKVLLGQNVSRTKPLFWEYGRNENSFRFPMAKDRSPSLAMMEGDWKFLCNHDGAGEELYNLIKDPWEKDNLVQSQKDRLKSMKSALLDYWKQMPKLN